MCGHVSMCEVHSSSNWLNLQDFVFPCTSDNSRFLAMPHAVWSNLSCLFLEGTGCEGFAVTTRAELLGLVGRQAISAKKKSKVSTVKARDNTRLTAWVRAGNLGFCLIKDLCSWGSQFSCDVSAASGISVVVKDEISKLSFWEEVLHRGQGDRETSLVSGNNVHFRKRGDGQIIAQYMTILVAPVEQSEQDNSLTYALLICMWSYYFVFLLNSFQ